jgi:hypothetical protein
MKTGMIRQCEGGKPMDEELEALLEKDCAPTGWHQARFADKRLSLI